MTYSKTFLYSGDGVLYAKPITPGSPPSSVPSWDDDIFDSNEPTSIAVTFTGLASGVSYWVFENSSGSGPSSSDIALAEISEDLSQSQSIAEIVDGVYNSLASIQPTVSLIYDPRANEIRLTDGDDWKLGVRTIDFPVTLPSGIGVEDCTATFGAVKGAARIDRVMEILLVDDIPKVRLTFFRSDTLNKPAGRYTWDVEVQHTSTGEPPVTSDITTLAGILELRRGVAKHPSDIA